MPYCSKCGVKMEEGERFCSNCGSEQQAVLPGIVSQKTATRKNRAGKTGAVLLGLVILILAGTIIYFNLPDSVLPGKEPGESDPGVTEKDNDGLSPGGSAAERGYIVVPDDYATIQAAIDNCDPGQVIEVKPGIYRENIDFRGKEIALRSTDPHDPKVVETTIINGNASGTVVTFQHGEGPGAVLDGFTITGGSGTRREFQITSYDGERLEFKRRYGGGILITGGSSPTITNNVIKENTVENVSSKELGIGAGIAVLDNSSPLIENNSINNNWSEGYGGGIAVWYKSSPVIKNNTIAHNSSDEIAGGILVTMMSDPVIAGNTISHNSSNSSGAIYVAHMSEATIRGNQIDSNNANLGAGLFIWRTDSVLIEDNVINNNRAKQNGGGIYLGNRASATVRNNIFDHNTALTRGGAVWVDKDSRVQMASPDDNSYRGNSPDNIYRR